MSNSKHNWEWQFDTSCAHKLAVKQGNDSLHVLERKIAEVWPHAEWRDTHVVLAVSGGADSVALLRAMLAIKASVGGSGLLYAAHLNHKLRDAESDADAAWVKELCVNSGLPVETAEVELVQAAAKAGDGLEAAARDARYTFLLQTAERLGARFVVTAHTADDQAETVLQRILRGTGIAGLSGIPRARSLSASVTLVRPMLSVWRREVMEYLDQLGQGYRRDASNDDMRHTRNRLRHALFPLIRREFNSGVDEALLRLAFHAAESQQIVDAVVSRVVPTCVTIERDPSRAGDSSVRVLIDCAVLTSEPTSVVREVLKAAWANANWPMQAMGCSEWKLLAEMAGKDRTQSAANLPGNIQARREGAMLVLAPALLGLTM